MIPSKEKIESEIKKLRSYIDKKNDSKNELDVIGVRIAYTVETALRWSIEDTVDWKTPLEEVLENTNILLDDKRFSK